MVHIPSSSSFKFPIIIYHCKRINCTLSMNKEKKTKSKKSPGTAQFKKNERIKKAKGEKHETETEVCQLILGFCFKVVIFYPMENMSVEIVVLGVAAKVLDRFRALASKQLHDDVPLGGVKDGRLEVLRPRLVLFGNGRSVIVGRLLVENVAVAGSRSVATSVPKTYRVS